MTGGNRPRAVVVRPKAVDEQWLRQPKRWSLTTAGRIVRYGAALIVIVGAVVVSLMNRLQVCEVVTSDAGKTTTCSPPTLTQASVLAVVAFVLAMLWPDIQEISAFGVSVKRLERKVAQVGREVVRVGSTTRRISTTVDTTNKGVTRLQMTLDSQAGQLGEMAEHFDRLGNQVRTAVARPRFPARNYGWIPVRTFAAVAADLMGPEYFAAQRRGLFQEIQGSAFPVMRGDVDLMRALLVGNLLELWRRLGGRLGSDTERQVQQGERVIDPESFDAALALLQQVIDDLAHGVGVDNAETLMTAVILARWLLGY